MDLITVVIRSCFVSLSSVNLMGLLKWRDNPSGLEQHLQQFMRVDGEEIVKVGFSYVY